MVCKLLTCWMLGLPNAHLQRVEVDTGSISLFEWREAGWATLLLNDTCHQRKAAYPEP